MSENSIDAIKAERRAALSAACDMVGGVTKLAEKIGKTRAHISTWKQRGMIPPDMAIPIEKASGVSRSVLRPDLYPEQESAA
ncbi:helix-turn-helix domain-containing protein [Mesorhizobium sp. M0028]|uniref:YdaS family helix-turn-helix protein n=1 Tax=Mesorhizobium sp. M0028 TaxID=2956849 RepID=UPI003335DEA8